MRFKAPAQWLLLTALALAFSFALQLAGVPGALLLGPMFAGVACATAGATVRLPRPLFTAAQGILGCMIAHTVSADVLLTIARDWAAMLLAVLSTVVFAGLVSYLLSRYGSLPGQVAAWGLSPGAAAAMVAMAEEFGSDPRIVAFMQYFRSASVVLSASAVTYMVAGPHAPATGGGSWMPSLPDVGDIQAVLTTLVLALGGGWLGRLARLPSAGLLGPMLIGSVLHAYGVLPITVPQWLIVLAYVAIGLYVGLRFTREAVRLVVQIIPQILVATVAMIGLGALSALVLVHLIGTDFLTAYLATSPGGLDSVAIIAVGTDTDLPLILALQTLRLFLVILTGPAIAKLVARLSAPSPDRHPSPE